MSAPSIRQHLEGPAPAELRTNEHSFSSIITLEGLRPLRPGAHPVPNATTAAPREWGPPKRATADLGGGS